MALKFGTSGVRGLVTELTDKEVSLFTKAFLIYAESLGLKSDVAIGYDLRKSSPQIQIAAIEAIHERHQNTFLCGKIPTPALAYYAQKKGLLAIMITGSHIPADRNGIKFYLKTGETLKADEQAIFRIYEGLKAKKTAQDGTLIGKSYNVSQAASELYINRYLNFFPEKCLSGYKLLFYQHSSIARDIFPDVLEKLGAEVIRIGKSETFIPVDTEAVDSVDQFKEWITQYKADALISTDGDADRPLFVDQTGTVLPGDKIGALTSLYLKCEAIALPISCNSGIFEMVNFKQIVATQIGSPFVIEILNKLAHEFSTVAGFEANGGYLLQTDLIDGNRELHKLPTRDAVLPVLSILALAKRQKIKTPELPSLLPLRYTASGLLKNYAAEKSKMILEMASQSPEDFIQKLLPDWNLKLNRVNKLDGLRFELSGRLVVHLRPSGNAPEFRCYTEAQEQERADALNKDTLQSLKTL